LAATGSSNCVASWVASTVSLYIDVDVLTGHVDVTEAASVEAFANAVHNRFDVVDLLVNNAGIAVVATFLDTELSDWKRLIDINLMGVVHGCHFFAPRMVQRGGSGHVVNVASQAGLQANLALSASSATKFAARKRSPSTSGVPPSAIAPSHR
jgi:NADP-dependent 3-hydroxy acid dehydrogenase YdfG